MINKATKNYRSLIIRLVSAINMTCCNNFLVEMKGTCYSILLLLSFQMFSAQRCPLSCEGSWFLPGCPVDCYCINVDHNVFCAGYGMQKIPDMIPSSTRVLELEDFNITSLFKLAFVRLPDLNILNLSNNQLTNTEALNYIKMPKLSLLELRNNLLTSFDFYVLTRFKGLTVVDLRYNHIKELNLDPEHSQSRNYSWSKDTLGDDIYTSDDTHLQRNMWNLAVDPTAANWLIHKQIFLEGNPIDCCLSKGALVEYGNIFFGNCSLPLNVRGLSFQEAISKIDCNELLQDLAKANSAKVADDFNSRLSLVVVMVLPLLLSFEGL